MDFEARSLPKYGRTGLNWYWCMIYDLPRRLPGQRKQPGWFNQAIVVPQNRLLTIFDVLFQYPTYCMTLPLHDETPPGWYLLPASVLGRSKIIHQYHFNPVLPYFGRGLASKSIIDNFLCAFSIPYLLYGATIARLNHPRLVSFTWKCAREIIHHTQVQF